MDSEKNLRHNKAMQKLKTAVDKSINDAQTERGVVVLLTGDGKGKSSSAFGMVMRALGYRQNVAVIQFIKGVQLSGEEIYLREQHPEVLLHQMATGFTWDTQNRETDIAAASASWIVAEQCMRDARWDLVILDELTYMLGFSYLEEQRVIDAIQRRPSHQSVVITGRGGGSALREIADTVSDVACTKHAFNAGIKARQGVDY